MMMMMVVMMMMMMMVMMLMMMVMMMTNNKNIVMMIKMQKMKTKMIAIPTFIYYIQTNIYPKGIPPPTQRHPQTSSPWGFAPSCLDAKSKSKGEVPRLTPAVGKIHGFSGSVFLPWGLEVGKQIATLGHFLTCKHPTWFLVRQLLWQLSTSVVPMGLDQKHEKRRINDE